MQCMEEKLGTRVFDCSLDNHEQKWPRALFLITTFYFSNLQTMQCIEVKLGTHVYFSVSMTTMNKKWPQALFDQERLLHFSNLQTMKCIEVKLCSNVHFSVSMTTINEKWPWAPFSIHFSNLQTIQYHAHESTHSFTPWSDTDHCNRQRYTCSLCQRPHTQ